MKESKDTSPNPVEEGVGVLKVASNFEKWMLGVSASLILGIGIFMTTKMVEVLNGQARLTAEVEQLKNKVSESPPRHYEIYVNSRFEALEHKFDRLSDQLDRIEAAVNKGN